MSGSGMIGVKDRLTFEKIKGLGSEKQGTGNRD